MGLIRLVLVHLQVSRTIVHRYVLRDLEDVLRLDFFGGGLKGRAASTQL